MILQTGMRSKRNPTRFSYSTGASRIFSGSTESMKRDGDGSSFLKAMAITGVVFSVAFMILQLIPIPGLSGVHFGIESYILLVVWIVLGLIFYFRERKFFTTE